MKTPHPLIVIGAAALLGVAACGSDDPMTSIDSEPSSGPSMAAEATPSTDTTPSTDAPEVREAVPLESSDAPAPTSPAPTTTMAPTTTAPATTTTVMPAVPRTLLIGDSTLLAVGSYEAMRALTGMDGVYEAESCRALGQPSCGDNPPRNAVRVLEQAQGPFDIVVIMAGYDEWYTTFATSFDQVVASSRAQGAKRIIWLTYPEGVDYLLPDGTAANESLVNMNQILRDKVASGAFPDVVIADWFHYSAVTQGWYSDDDIHLSQTGAFGVADYISRKIAFLVGAPCPVPRDIGQPAESPCPDPDVSGPVRDVVALYTT